MMIGTFDPERRWRASSNPVSPGIITSRINRSKLSPSSFARASAAASALVTRYPSATRKRDSRLRMRRSSSTTRRCGASSAKAAAAVFMAGSGRRSAARTPRPVGASDEPQRRVALLRVDHRGKEPARRLVCIRSKLGERPRDACRLQSGELHGQGLAFRRHVKQPLTAIVGALLLQHVTLVDQLLEYAAKRLLRDLENVQQLGDLHAGVAVDEMQDPVMRAAEPEFGQHIIGIADEVAIGKEQELDDVPDRLAA